MLTEESVRRECRYSNTLVRALRIVANPWCFIDKRCTYGRYTTVDAFVESLSYSDEGYDASITFNEETDEIVSYSCTCPAYAKYPGICKHAAALGLLFIREPNGFKGFTGFGAVSSSPSIAALLKATLPSAGARNKNAPAAGSLSLELTITEDYYGRMARFKLVSPNASYVVKNIEDFVARVERREFHEYGKKLAFVHDIALFTPLAQDVIRLLQRAIQPNPVGTHGYRYAPRTSVTRDLPLNAATAIDLLDLYTDTPFLYDDGTSVRSKPKGSHVVRGNPPLHMTVHPLEKGGYELEREKSLGVIRLGTRTYVILDGLFYRCTDDFSPAAQFLGSVYCSWDDRLLLSEDDLPRFCAGVLPILEHSLSMDVPSQMAALKPEPCKLEFYLDKVGFDCECRAKAVYGGEALDLMDPEWKPGQPVRDVSAEERGRELVEQLFPGVNEAGHPATTDEEETGRVLFGGVAQLRLLGEVFTTPAFDRMASTRSPHVQTGVSLEANLINLSIKATELPPVELAQLLSSYQKRKHYHRLSDGSYLSLMGTAAADMGLEELDHLYRSLDLTDKQLAAEGAKLPLSQAFLLDSELDDERKDEAFSRFIADFKGAGTKKHAVPRALADVLRPYQREGFSWLNLLADSGLAGILADEMGLGKSLQVIALLLHRRKSLKSAPALIVCPASLVYNWVAEFDKFAPTMRVEAVAGNKGARSASRGKPGVEVFVTSYDSLRLDIDQWGTMSFFACVIDEAQYIKNHATKVARSVKAVNAKHRLALTGTPIENRLSELWSIFDFLMPGMLGRYNRFKERYELPIVGGDEDMSARLASLVGPFILRRRKADVLTDLPDKMEVAIRCKMDDEQRKLYDAHEQRLRMQLDGESDQVLSQDKIAVLAELTKLRQLCCDPRLLFEDFKGESAKMGAILELLESARESEQKVLLFSQFTSFLDLIAAELHRNRIAYYTITGKTPKRKRLDLVDRFNADDTPVFLISLKAGGTGLNLTGASVVVHADPWWNQAAQSQATDRAHRIGQTRDVTVYQVIAQDTIEDRILKLQEAKSQLADAVLAADSKSLGQLSRDELVGLLSEG